MSVLIDSVLNIEILENRRLEFPLVVTLAVTLVSGAAWFVAGRLTRKAALRHVVLSAAVFVCLASPATVWLCEAAGLTLVSVPLFEEEQATVAVNVPSRETEPVCTATPLPLPTDGLLAATNGAGQPGPAAPMSELVVGCCPEPNADAASGVPTASTPTVATASPIEDAAATSPRTAVAVVMLVWTIGTGVLLARLAASCWCVVRLRRSSRPAHEEHLLALLRTVAGDVEMRPAPLLLVTKRTVTPQAVGFGRPAIVLPARLLGNIGDEELRDVLTHETAHLKRGDQHTVILQRMAAALYWPIVTVHTLNHELQRSREELCDNAVLAGRDAIDYGRTLLHVAELLVNARRHAAMVGMIGGRGELERRVAGLIDPRRSTLTKAGRKTACAVTALFVAGGMIASTTRFVPSAGAGEHDGGSTPDVAKEEPATVVVDSTTGRSQPNGQTGIPPADSGADVALVLDKPEYFLGENVVLHWRIRNGGERPLDISIGGDGRTPGARRAIRFKVEVLDADGTPMPDPYPNPANFGGFGSDAALEPGQEFWHDLQLMRFREITKPGTYTIRVYHDLGWEKIDPEEAFPRSTASDIPPEPLRAPIVTASVRLRMPNAEQSRQVVDTMSAMPDDAGRSWGKKGETFADFELLRYPVYLPIAKELAQQGDARGLEALGAMAFPDATAALLELMSHADAAVAARAGDLLASRAPSVHDTPPSRRSYLVERSWTDQLRTSTTASAWKLLAGNDRKGLIRGARLIESLGTKDDLPALIAVMDRVLVRLKNDPVEQQAYLRPAIASETLADATRELLRRGAAPPDAASTPGHAVAWLLGLGVDNDFRPDRWRETLRGLIEHEIPFVRDIALRNVPLPLDEVTAAVVAKAISDDFAPVQGAACDLAGKDRSEAFGPPLMNVLKSTRNDWVLRAAFGAAVECGVDNDRRLEACVRRMEPRTNDWNMLLLSLLIDGTIDQNGHGARTIDDWTPILPGIQAAWLDFIDAHRQELREGKPFKVGSPPLTPEMFPPGFQLHRAGQSAWPEDPAQPASRTD